jgi:Co/Zn/Cd efflux system component
MMRSELSACAAASCCTSDLKFDGLSRGYKTRLWAVIALNASMFAVEISAGVMAGSQALQADALDFLGDTLTYGMSLAVIGLSLRARATAALIKGATLAFMGLWVLGTTVLHMLFLGTPRAEVMGLIGFLALAANLASVLILLKYKDGDANVRSVWLCSRNDAIGNIAAMLAALGVWGTATGWPDVLVAAIIASLFLNSSSKILRQALGEWRLTHATRSAAEHRGKPIMRGFFSAKKGESSGVLKVLDERYPRGEIVREEYLRRREDVVG